MEHKKIIERLVRSFGRIFSDLAGQLDGTFSKRQLHRVFAQLIKEGGPALAEQLRALAVETAAYADRVTPKALGEASSNAKVMLGGGFAGTILGWILGGGSIGVVGLGMAVGIPVVAMTGILGVVIASIGYRDLLPLARQWRASAERAEALHEIAEQAKDGGGNFFFLNGAREHRRFLLHQLDTASRYLTLRSAFISSFAVNDEFVDKLRGALARGVRVTIEYGYYFPGADEIEDKAGRKQAIERLRGLHREAAENGWPPLRLSKTPTHVKEIAVDDLQLAIGGFNWLSNASQSQKANAERSIVLCNEQFARDVRMAAHDAADRFGRRSAE